MMPDGRQVPLDTVANSEEKRDWGMITRVNGQRTVTVQANVDARQASAQDIVSDMQAHWLASLQQLHPSVHVSFEGQVARSAETAGSRSEEHTSELQSR